ncbi:YceI family protein [Streptomyces monticola]|uniref:YceI family protein n=1 Tax=Streptomyces monticola TaxID=2666263 RepID=A0ABW2JFS5_9ACTN
MTASYAQERPAPATGAYDIDPRTSRLRFRTRAVFGLMPVRGTFTLTRGRIVVAEPVARSSVEVVVGAASFDSGLRRRDEHVRSDDYLGAVAHPEIIFRSEEVRDSRGEEVRDSRGDEGRDVAQVAALAGELTVRGVTRPVAVAVETVELDGPGLVVTGSAAVDRYAFGITTAKGMTGRWVRIDLEVRARRRPV